MITRLIGEEMYFLIINIVEEKVEKSSKLDWNNIFDTLIRLKMNLQNISHTKF